MRTNEGLELRVVPADRLGLGHWPFGADGPHHPLDGSKEVLEEIGQGVRPLQGADPRAAFASGRELRSMGRENLGATGRERPVAYLASPFDSGFDG